MAEMSVLTFGIPVSLNVSDGAAVRAYQRARVVAAGPYSTLVAPIFSQLINGVFL